MTTSTFTDATLLALNNLRDLSMLKWYVIPLLSIVFYIYTREIKEARQTRNWDAVFAGITIFGVRTAFLPLVFGPIFGWISLKKHPCTQ